jgi:Reverse transcriptase (RNA-dependent DNA polymerase)
VALFEQQHSPRDDDKAAACPTLAEVAECIEKLRNLATPGEDQIDARMLKAGPVMHQWMHRIICAVWRSGKCPPEWKSALIIALYKGKGAKDTAGNYRGISLLSIAGKVYAIILMHRVYVKVDPQLHEAQNGFRKGRGTVDAIYTLRALSAACSEHNVCMAKAYIDFTKAYDSVNRWLLWKALRLYDVHPKIISLLEDLHHGTQAAVRLGSQVGPRFHVVAGVRQGCVIAPTLFNVLMDLVIKKALLRMPDDCGIKFKRRGWDATDIYERIVLLMYADDVVLLSNSVEQLVCMLQVLDQVACEFGMKINASKTKIQVQDTHQAEVPPVSISSGAVDTEAYFKYLGSGCGQDCGMDKEIEIRRARTVGVFESFNRVWDNQKLGMSQKMAVYNAFIMPHFLYGCEAWNCTASQLHMLETAHSACLRRIMGVDRHGHHSLQHIYKVCGSHPLTLHVIQHVFRWLGHVHRMPAERYPHMVYECVPVGGARRRGRPKSTFRHTYIWMLQHVLMDGVGLNDEMAKSFVNDMEVRAQDRKAWCGMIDNMSFNVKGTSSLPTRRSARLQSIRHHAQVSRCM